MCQAAAENLPRYIRVENIVKEKQLADLAKGDDHCSDLGAGVVVSQSSYSMLSSNAAGAENKQLSSPCYEYSPLLSYIHAVLYCASVDLGITGHT